MEKPAKIDKMDYILKPRRTVKALDGIEIRGIEAVIEFKMRLKQSPRDAPTLKFHPEFRDIWGVLYDRDETNRCIDHKLTELTVNMIFPQVINELAESGIVVKNAQFEIISTHAYITKATRIPVEIVMKWIIHRVLKLSCKPWHTRARHYLPSVFPVEKSIYEILPAILDLEKMHLWKLEISDRKRIIEMISSNEQFMNLLQSSSNLDQIENALPIELMAETFKELIETSNRPSTELIYESLQELIACDDPDLRQWAIVILSCVYKEQNIVNRLIEMLRNGCYTGWVIEQLGLFGVAANSAKPYLKDIVHSSKDINLIQDAVKAIERIEAGKKNFYDLLAIWPLT